MWLKSKLVFIFGEFNSVNMESVINLKRKFRGGFVWDHGALRNKKLTKLFFVGIIICLCWKMCPKDKKQFLLWCKVFLLTIHLFLFLLAYDVLKIKINLSQFDQMLIMLGFNFFLLFFNMSGGLCWLCLSTLTALAVEKKKIVFEFV